MIVETGCIVRHDAPGGCLGAVDISAVTIPAVTIPGLELDDRVYPGGDRARRLPGPSYTPTKSAR